MPKVFQYASRVLLTILVVAALVLSLKLVLMANAMLQESVSQAKSPPSINLAAASRPAPGDSTASTPWPAFLRNKPRNVRSSIINGVQTVTDRWESSLPASEVLAYYHEQMTARGWRDVTEETYSLQPELREGLSGDDDERYSERYREVMESTLVMNSGLWTMHVRTGPSKRGPGYVTVDIYGAAAPSIPEFSRSLESTFASSPSQPNRPFEAVQRSGGQVSRTTIAATDRQPEDAFQRQLAVLQEQGWLPMLVLPSQQGLSSHFAWLVKGEAYMAMSVSPQGQGRCSVSTTEVMPEKTASGSRR